MIFCSTIAAKSAGHEGAGRGLIEKLSARIVPSQCLGKGLFQLETFAKLDAKNFTKVIKAVRSPKTGAYTFKESILHKDKIKEFLAAK